MTAHTVAGDSGNGWRDDAACLDHPAEWFTGPHAPGDTRRAIDVCNTCPVKQPCLEAALQIEVSADLGIWGGTTPTTRRRLRGGQSETRSELASGLRPAAGITHVDGAQTAGNTPELFEDERGDYVDRTGRVIVFEIHGEPPYMLMIDGKPRARTGSVHEAAVLAGHRVILTDAASQIRSEPRASACRR